MKCTIIKTISLLIVLASMAEAQMGSATSVTPMPSVPPSIFDVPLDVKPLRELTPVPWNEGLFHFPFTLHKEQLELEPMLAFAPMELAPIAELGSLIFSPSSIHTVPVAELFDPGDQDDPGYATYKKGYNLILEEKWNDARKVLSEVGTKFPKSKYVDDAQYWIAYSLKHSDKKKSIEAYKKFLERYPDSNYYDDAVADLNRLENPNAATVVGIESVETPLPPSRSLDAMAREARAAVRALPPTPAIPPMEGFSVGSSKEKGPELRMKIEALYALGRSSQDEKTFEVLKETALNKEQPRELREAALDMLRNFKGRNVSALFMELVNDDYDKMLQRTALYWIGQLSEGNAEKTFSILKSVATDHNRSREIRETAFHSLAQLKRGDVVNIFVEIAKNDPDKHIQQTALYYIGQSARRGDEEKVFQVLKEFALDQKRNRELRESALHALRELKKGEAINTYLEIAKNDPDDRMRSSALYYIGEAGEKETEKAFAIYKEFLLDHKQSRNVRESVIYSLTNLKHPGTLNLLLQVAKSDPDERIQQSAIYQIGQLSKNKAKNLETLISLYDSMPKDRTRSLESLLYAVASIGNDQAVDFLSKVAKTSENYDIRRKAVYYLGNIGGDKARAVLFEILQSK